MSLADIIRKCPDKDGTKFGRKQNQLLLTVQSQVLSEFGLDRTSTGGVMAVMFGSALHSERPEIAWNKEKINI